MKKETRTVYVTYDDKVFNNEAAARDHESLLDLKSLAKDLATKSGVDHVHLGRLLRENADKIVAVLSAFTEKEPPDLAASVNAVYTERAQCIAALCDMAQLLGWKCGHGRHQPDPDPNWDPDWLNVVFIDLPTGQVSWHVAKQDIYLFAHLPAYDGKWDGHSTEEKHNRLRSLGPQYGPPKMKLVVPVNDKDFQDWLRKVTGDAGADVGWLSSLFHAACNRFSVRISLPPGSEPQEAYRALWAAVLAMEGKL